MVNRSESFDFKKGKKKFFNKDKKNSRPEGYTNNPKYFEKQKEDTSTNDSEGKKFSFTKGKKKFKKRSRPKSFEFKKHRKNRS